MTFTFLALSISGSNIISGSTFWSSCYAIRFGSVTKAKQNEIVHILHRVCPSSQSILMTFGCTMMTSSNGNIFRVTGQRWIPRTRPVARSVDVFFDVRLNRWLSKQSWGWWLETLSRPLWRHCNAVHVSHTLHSNGIAIRQERSGEASHIIALSLTYCS